MKILVFEWLVGGGVAGDQRPRSDDPFLIQGADMYGAILDDCLQLGIEVLSPLDPRLTMAIANFAQLQQDDNFHITPVNNGEQLKPTLGALADAADHIFLIAPECTGILHRCLQWLNGFESKLLCGPQNLINLFADKNQTQSQLKLKKISVPEGCSFPPASVTGGGDWAPENLIAASQILSWPLVVKPTDGAGGADVLICRNLQQLEIAAASQKGTGQSLRLECYIAGTPVSVSVVRNEHETRLLPASKQQFSNAGPPQAPGVSKKTGPEPIGHFVGSVYPLENALQQRAEALALSVADAFPTWRGYLGIDMVLADEGPDVVIELNPRLTASYPAIRAATGFNLIEFLLESTKNRA